MREDIYLPKTDVAKCLIAGCDRPVRARGLCSRCDSAARFAIKTSKTTEEELLRLGLILPRPAHRPKVYGCFAKVLAAKKASEKAEVA